MEIRVTVIFSTCLCPDCAVEDLFDPGMEDEE
jgi:hypothetical protein